MRASTGSVDCTKGLRRGGPGADLTSEVGDEVARLSSDVCVIAAVAVPPRAAPDDAGMRSRCVFLLCCECVCEYVCVCVLSLCMSLSMFVFVRVCVCLCLCLSAFVSVSLSRPQTIPVCRCGKVFAAAFLVQLPLQTVHAALQRVIVSLQIVHALLV